MQRSNNKRKEFQVERQFSQFVGHEVIVGLKNWEELEGKIISIDNYLNTVIETEDGLRVVKGGKLAFISIKE